MSPLFDACPVLRQRFDTQAGHVLSDGKPVQTNIRMKYAEALFNTVAAAKPTTVVEIGMAYGFSTLAILAGLERAGGNGRLISIDPLQTTMFNSDGTNAVAKAGLQHRHELIEDYSYNALPRLLASGLRIGFSYIDGCHVFDNVMLDCLYSDKMLDIGGIMAFNDCGFPPVAKVIGFLQTHRKYSELDVGLRHRPRIIQYLRSTLLRTLGRKPHEYFPNVPDRYFKKTDQWQPGWDTDLRF